MIETNLILMFVAGLLIAVAIGFFFWGMKHALVLALNSVIGFFALQAVVLWIPVKISVWSVLLVAIFGLAGLLLVLLFHWMGFWF